MIIDSKGKLFGKISIIDLLIVLVVLAALFGVYYKFGRSKTTSPIFNKADNIQVTFFCEDAPDYAAKSIKTGDLVKDRTSGVVIGTVKKVDIGPDVFYYGNDRGEMIKSSKEGYNSVTIVVEGKGVFSSNGVTFGGTDFFVNKSLEYYVGNADFFMKISGFNKIKE